MTKLSFHTKYTLEEIWNFIVNQKWKLQEAKDSLMECRSRCVSLENEIAGLQTEMHRMTFESENRNLPARREP